MFDMNSRARSYALRGLCCAAAVVATACAHPQQAPPADSASPRQYGGGHMRHGGPHGEAMMRGLNLTSDQRAQITLIRDQYRLRGDSLRLNNSGRDSTSRGAFRSLMTQQMADIRAVLTPDQQKDFDQRMAKMREHRQMHGPNGAPHDSAGGPPA